MTVRLHARSLHWKLALNPGLHAGEAWMDGTLTIEDASLHGLLDLLGRNLAATGQSDIRGPLDGLRHLFRRAQQFNPAARACRNVAHHYDLSAEFSNCSWIRTGNIPAPISRRVTTISRPPS